MLVIKADYSKDNHFGQSDLADRLSREYPLESISR